MVPLYVISVLWPVIIRLFGGANPTGYHRKSFESDLSTELALTTKAGRHEVQIPVIWLDAVKLSPWLFPLTYVIHVTEEYFGGEGFPAWSSRVTGHLFTNQNFIKWNLVAFLVIIIAAVLSSRRNFRWIPVTLAALILINATTHTIGTIATQSYSPGLISALVLWLPLGYLTLKHFYKIMERPRFIMAAVAGFGSHAVVSIISFFGGRLG
ncbi:MAG: hypothetical protein C5B54_02780 [Acidobacteria bacterium]|nr:MAG: hypothetical protein C5B54_02780 [Acidobacteriota bacterium]